MLRYVRIGIFIALVGLSTFVVLQENTNFRAQTGSGSNQCYETVEAGETCPNGWMIASGYSDGNVCVDPVGCGCYAPEGDECTCANGRTEYCSAGQCPCYPICGDGYVDEGEQCDDGNTGDFDGCDSTCQIECGVCRVMYEDPMTGEQYHMCERVNATETSPGNWSCPDTDNACTEFNISCEPGENGGTDTGDEGGQQGGDNGGSVGSEGSAGSEGSNASEGSEGSENSEASQQSEASEGSTESKSSSSGKIESESSSSQNDSDSSASSSTTSYRQSSDDSESSEDSCGDGQCSENEDCESCPDDCGCQGSGCSEEQCVQGECRAPSQADADANCPPPQDACKPYKCQMSSGECKVEKIDSGPGVNLNGETCQCNCALGEVTDCLAIDTYKNSCQDVADEDLPEGYTNPFAECSAKIYEYFDSLDYSNEDTWNLEENMNVWDDYDPILPGEEFNEDIGGGSGGGGEETKGCSQVMMVSCDFENSCGRARFRNAWAGKTCCSEGKQQTMLGPENPGDDTYTIDFQNACNGAASGSMEVALCPCEGDSSSSSSDGASAVSSSSAGNSESSGEASSQASEQSSDSADSTSAGSSDSAVFSSQSSADSQFSYSTIIAFSSFSFDFSDDNSNDSSVEAQSSSSSSFSFTFSTGDSSETSVPTVGSSSASGTPDGNEDEDGQIGNQDDDDGIPDNQDNDDDGDGDTDDGIPGNQDEDDDGDGIDDDGQVGNQDEDEFIPRLSSDSNRTSETLIAAAGICGDGLLGDREECDDSNRRDNDGCSSSCLLEVGICGDGIVQKLLGEQCEQSSHDSSLPYSCVRCEFVSTSCGDGTVDPGEECDDGPQNSTSPDANCRPNCRIGTCGDGILDSVEQCDDGNRLSGDGCDRYCTVERSRGGSSSRQTIVASDTTNVPFTTATPNTFPYGAQFPNQPNMQQLPYRLPLAQLQPLVQSQGPVGDTGPAAVAVIGAGAAAGWSWVKRRRRKK